MDFLRYVMTLLICFAGTLFYAMSSFFLFFTKNTDVASFSMQDWFCAFNAVVALVLLHDAYFLLCCSQSCLLGPLLFIMYTTPLITLISFISFDHHLYADGTLLFSAILTLTQAFLTFKMLFNRSLSWWLLIFLLLTALSLNSYS